ncbi:MAG: T9SS type A sorting domain-containing protein, partial [Deltaproteobacteria bacterium]|nr:T9SS type A sorting domain-containing protein [Deltaproteobacteria bacterium]
PVLDTTPYDTLLDNASLQPEGKKVFKDLNLGGETLLVNGDFELKAKGSITGPGTVVATKGISIKEDSILIGEGITLIAGEKLEIKEGVTSPGGFGHIFFSRKEINIKENSQIAGALVSLGQVEIKEQTVFNGIVYSTGEANIKEKSRIIGSIAAKTLKEVKEDASVIYDSGLVHELVTKVFIAGDVVAVPILEVPVSPNVPQGKPSLAQNYPNPFNPETWIPYTLTEGSNVKIQIYNVAGRLIRTLDVGYKDPGYYLERNKAAYWNGRNELGEQIASGVYFYVMRAGSFRATKKMVIIR